MTQENEILQHAECEEERALSPEATKTLKSARDVTDRRAWERKIRILRGLTEEANEISDKIIDLETERQELWDKITLMRDEMVVDCIHLPTMCVEVDGLIVCKFCNKKIKIVDHGS